MRRCDVLVPERGGGTVMVPSNYEGVIYSTGSIAEVSPSTFHSLVMPTRWSVSFRAGLRLCHLI